MKKKLLSGVTILIITANPVYAADLFNLTATVFRDTVPSQTGTASFDTIEDIIDSVDSQHLQSIIPSYTPTSAANIELNIRGLPATVTYAANRTTLVFQVPSLNISEQFTGATRDQSQDLFETYLEENGDGILTQMLQSLAATTAIDPVAGNPNSLMATMGASSFDVGTDVGGSQMIKGETPSGNNLLSMGMMYGGYSAGDYSQDVYTLPLRYAIHLDSDPRKQVILDMPITCIDTEGGKTYSAAFGATLLRYPVTDNWTLTPAIRTGAVGSVDLGSAAILYSGSLTSNYNLYWDELRVSIGNMAAQFKTTSIDAGDYSVDYDLSNTMIKNGVGVEVPLSFSMLGKSTSWQFDVAHTAFFGDPLYIDSYVDVSMSLGTRAPQSDGNIRFGFTYTAGNHSFNGLRVNCGYTF